jgi:hypothetical protein
MDAPPLLLTADEYLRHPLGQEPGELVRGVMHVMTPAGGPSGSSPRRRARSRAARRSARFRP